jgi:hypothetical protein
MFDEPATAERGGPKRGGRLVEYLEERIGEAVKRAGKRVERGSRVEVKTEEMNGMGVGKGSRSGSEEGEMEFDWGGSGVVL